MRVLVTGGAGYIGSHTCLELLAAGHDVTIIDNLSASHMGAIKNLEAIAGRRVSFHKIDLLDRLRMTEVFAYPVDIVFHFAGKKSVSESIEKSLEYYRINVAGTISLLDAMRRTECRKLVFSSSCTVFGDSSTEPIPESSNREVAMCPYGRSKAFVEQILQDMFEADSSWSIAILRYFNPAGAHESGDLGEDPCGSPSSLFHILLQVAAGKRDFLRVFGNDYPTSDGTPLRDYIHVVDVARAHLRAIDRLSNARELLSYNIGTGQGSTVLQVVSAFESSIGVRIPLEFAPRRPGDASTAYADATKAERELSWKAERGLEDMCRDSWRWQQRHPEGYSGLLRTS